jgi:hypothetical protein
LDAAAEDGRECLTYWRRPHYKDNEGTHETNGGGIVIGFSIKHAAPDYPKDEYPYSQSNDDVENTRSEVVAPTQPDRTDQQHRKYE